MKCEFVRGQFIDYYYRELPPDAILEISRHLEQCASCKEHYQARIEMLDSLKLKGPEMPERFWSGLRRKILERIDRTQKKRVFVLRPAPAFATLLLLIAMIFGGIRYFDSRRTENSIAENFGLLQQFELYENLELFEHMDEIDHLEQV
jgi:anti-sigma factor RsiW